MEKTKDKGKFIMNHENLLKGVEYVISFLHEVKAVTSKQLKYYKYPQFIFRGISKFYPYQSKTGINFPENKQVENDTIRSGLSVRLDSYDNNKPETKPYIRANYVNILRDMIKTAKRHFPDKYQEEMSDLDILADIQHNGGATCLVDFSKNVLTALWFACNADTDADGFVYCYDVMHDIIVNDCLSYIKDESQPVESLLAQTYRETNICSDVDTRFCIWEPSSRNNRIIRQDSVFVFGMEKFIVKDHGIEIIRIDADKKECILLAMEAFFNVSEDTIFNDSIGFAHANRKTIPYRKLENSAYTRGFDDMINGNYEAALEFFKLYESECRKKATMEELIEMHFSLAVCYKHIKRANKTITYEENAIIEYSQVIKLIRKMFSNKCHEKIALKQDRDYYIRKCTRAYNGIFDMLYETKQYEKAICKCDELICDIESGMLENKSDKTLPMNKELSPIYCKITKMELLDLQLMKDYKNMQNYAKEKIMTYREDAFKVLKGEKQEKYFDKLLIEYYTLVYQVLVAPEEEKDKFKKDFSRLIINMKNSFEEAEPYNSYILWNFADIKEAIKKLDLGGSSFKKELLLSATAQIIAFRDEFEVQSLRNLQDY